MKTFFLIAKLSLALSCSTSFAMEQEKAPINPGPKHKILGKNEVRHVMSLLWGKQNLPRYDFSEDQNTWIAKALNNDLSELKVAKYLKKNQKYKGNIANPNTPKALWNILELFKEKFKNDDLRQKSIEFISRDTFDDLVNQSRINTEDKNYYRTPVGKERLCKLFTEEPTGRRPYLSRGEKLSGLIEEPFLGKDSNPQDSSAVLIEAGLENHLVLSGLPENALQHINAILWNEKNFSLLKFDKEQKEYISERLNQKPNTSEALWEVFEGYQKEFGDDLLRGKILSLIYDYMLPEPEQNFKNLIDAVKDLSEAEKAFYNSNLGREKIAKLLLINPKKNNNSIDSFSKSTEDQILENPSIKLSSKKIAKTPRRKSGKETIKKIMGGAKRILGAEDAVIETGNPELNNYLNSFSGKLARNEAFQQIVKKFVVFPPSIAGDPYNQKSDEMIALSPNIDSLSYNEKADMIDFLCKK